MATQKSKRRTINAATGKMLQRKMAGQEPHYEESLRDGGMSDDQQIMTALNWYSSVTTDKKERSWFLNYTKQHDLLSDNEIARARTMNPSWFYRSGRYTQMIQHGYPEAELVPYINKATNDLITKIKATIQERAEQKKNNPPPISIQERMSKKSTEHTISILQMVDEYTTKNYNGNLKKNDKDFDIDALIVRRQIGPKMSAMILPMIEYDRKILYDGYDKEDELNISKTQFNRTIKMYDQIIESLKFATKQSDTRRKKTTKKFKTPEQITQKIQYAQHTDLFGGIDGEEIKNIVGATKVILFSLANHRITMFESEDRAGFGFKGSAIIGIDPKKTICRSSTMKKLPAILASLRSKSNTIRALRSSMSNLPVRGTAKTPNPRITKNIMVIRTIK